MADASERPFVIFGLPRSRTAWLAHWLAASSRWVGHDIGIECHSMGDFAEPFEHGMSGTVETGSMIAWQEIREMLDPAMVVVKRPVWQVLHSMSRLGFRPEGLVEEMLKRDALLDEISAQAGTLTVPFDELKNHVVAKRLWEHCLPGVKWEPRWYALENGLNIQIDIGQRVDQLVRARPHLEALKADFAKRELPCIGSC